LSPDREIAELAGIVDSKSFYGRDLSIIRLQIGGSGLPEAWAREKEKK